MGGLFKTSKTNLSKGLEYICNRPIVNQHMYGVITRTTYVFKDQHVSYLCILSGPVHTTTVVTHVALGEEHTETNPSEKLALCCHICSVSSHPRPSYPFVVNIRTDEGVARKAVEDRRRIFEQGVHILDRLSVARNVSYSLAMTYILLASCPSL